MLEKYVDDVLTGQEEMKLGTKWNPKDQCLEWTQEQLELDKTKDPQEVTMTAIAAMASSILSCLEFTWDAPCLNPSKKMPVLDTQVWVGTQIREWSLPKCLIPDGVELPTKHGPLKQIILYQFYRKAIANHTPFNSRAAYPERDRISTISQDFIRRFKNTSRELP